MHTALLTPQARSTSEQRSIHECNGNQVKTRKYYTNSTPIQIQVRYIEEQDRKILGKNNICFSSLL
jgi:hypothetical protein